MTDVDLSNLAYRVLNVRASKWARRDKWTLKSESHGRYRANHVRVVATGISTADLHGRILKAATEDVTRCEQTLALAQSWLGELPASQAKAIADLKARHERELADQIARHTRQTEKVHDAAQRAEAASAEAKQTLADVQAALAGKEVTK